MKTFLILLFSCLIKFHRFEQIIYIEDYCSHESIPSEPNLTPTGGPISLTVQLSRTGTLSPDKQFCWLRIITDDGYRILGTGQFGHLRLLTSDAPNRFDLEYDPNITENKVFSSEFDSPLVITLENPVKNFVNHSTFETMLAFSSFETNDLASSSGEIASCDGFTCANQECIAEEMRCDNRDDCGDNSDEHNCETNNSIEEISRAKPVISGSTSTRFVLSGYLFFMLLNIILINI